jgi:hypothetical protein
MFAAPGETVVMQRIPRDEFLSEEDLDLRSLTPEARDRVFEAWLPQAQSTNEQDRHLYSHGVFTREPPWPKQTP